MPARNGTRALGQCSYCKQIILTHQHAYTDPEDGRVWHLRCRLAFEIEKRGDKVPPHLQPPRWWET
jgi:hypothetical protein